MLLNRSLGTSASPLEDISYMGIAKAVLEDQYKTPNGACGFYLHNTDFWTYTVDKWEVTKREVVEDLVWHWLSDAYHYEIGAQGIKTIKKMRVSKNVVLEVVRAIEAQRRLLEPKLPLFISGSEGRNPSLCIGFKDMLLDVEASAKSGQMVFKKRAENFMDSVTLPVNLDLNAECPVWLNCLKEWGGGDPAWATLLQRSMAYRFLSFRGFAKWFMYYGAVRGGKGTIETVMRELMGPHAYVGVRMSSLGKQFGLHKLVRARTFVVSEITELDKLMGEESSGLIKNLVGRDPIDLDRKHTEGLENVVSDACVVLVGNELPQLPNKGRGLSSKMVPINFDSSFEGKEDFFLADKLRGELAGIAAWIAKGAVELIAEPDSKKKFPLTEGGLFAMEKYHMLNNPADTFLNWAFVKNKDRFVSSELVWGLYEQFMEQMKWQKMSRIKFNGWLESTNSWGVRKYREAGGGKNGFKGLALKEKVGFTEAHT